MVDDDASLAARVNVSVVVFIAVKSIFHASLAPSCFVPSDNSVSVQMHRPCLVNMLLLPIANGWKSHWTKLCCAVSHHKLSCSTN